MFKRGLIFLGFLLLALVVYVQGRELLLAFYVLFLLLLFPLYYFFDRQDRFLFSAAVFITAAAYGIFLFHERTVEMISFGFGYGGVFLILAAYRNFWISGMRAQTLQTNNARTELETLKQKYQSRLESLHHLEKQVSSLLELFEIARDFSECLSFESMSDLLVKKVLPLLPFRRMRLILVTKLENGVSFSRNFVITPKGVTEGNSEFSDKEIKIFNEIRESKQIVKTPQEVSSEESQEQWFFPLVLEGEVAALLTVEAENAEDLVKFEVLVAHLVLQVKKIRLYETVKELSIADGLTGVYVRRHFLERFSEELKRSIKYSLPLAVLMLDIDHFKRYNDEFGHLVGDATLKEVASLLRDSLRKVDIVARYGGEEFIAVLPETHGEAAGEVAERIRSQIARHPIKVYDVETKVTVSIGIALFPSDIDAELRNEYYDDLGFDLIRHADKALYRAKEEGRNRVFRFQDL
jgi:diguanylate cyclase (GGDEF)-like protein